MNKPLIFIIVLVVLLVLLCAKLMFEDGTQQSTGKQNHAGNAGKTPPTTMPASNGGSTTRPEANPRTEAPRKPTKQLVAGGRLWNGCGNLSLMSRPVFPSDHAIFINDYVTISITQPLGLCHDAIAGFTLPNLRISEFKLRKIDLL